MSIVELVLEQNVEELMKRPLELSRLRPSVEDVDEEELVNAILSDARITSLVVEWGDDELYSLVVRSMQPIAMHWANQLRPIPIEVFESVREMEASGIPYDAATIIRYFGSYECDKLSPHLPLAITPDIVQAALDTVCPSLLYEIENRVSVYSRDISSMFDIDDHGALVSYMRKHNLMVSVNTMKRFACVDGTYWSMLRNNLDRVYDHTGRRLSDMDSGSAEKLLQNHLARYCSRRV